MTDVAAPPADLRRTDVFAWLKAQAEALRAHVIPDDPERRSGTGGNAIAYDELAEEVDGLAQSVRAKGYSLTARMIEHLYKLEFVDSPRNRPGWRKEIIAFRGGLGRSITPSLRNEIIPDLPSLARRELKGLVAGELIADPVAVAEARPEGYAWAEITDDDGWPEPVSGAEVPRHG